VLTSLVWEVVPLLPVPAGLAVAVLTSLVWEVLPPLLPVPAGAAEQPARLIRATMARAASDRRLLGMSAPRG
jgi:hypothetical protein